MFGLPKFGDGIGLDRILRFYRDFRIDTEALARRSIVVTGSNGKGSTSRFIASALAAAGRRAGLFTSPHLFDYRERFVIGDMRIPQADFDRHAEAVRGFQPAALPKATGLAHSNSSSLSPFSGSRRKAPTPSCGKPA